jgi:hypothetical protein
MDEPETFMMISSKRLERIESMITAIHSKMFENVTQSITDVAQDNTNLAQDNTNVTQDNTTVTQDNTNVTDVAESSSEVTLDARDDDDEDTATGIEGKGKFKSLKTKAFAAQYDISEKDVLLFKGDIRKILKKDIYRYRCVIAMLALKDTFSMIGVTPETKKRCMGFKVVTPLELGTIKRCTRQTFLKGNGIWYCHVHRDLYNLAQDHEAKLNNS